MKSRHATTADFWIKKHGTLTIRLTKHCYWFALAGIETEGLLLYDRQSSCHPNSKPAWHDQVTRRSKLSSSLHPYYFLPTSYMLSLIATQPLHFVHLYVWKAGRMSSVFHCYRTTHLLSSNHYQAHSLCFQFLTQSKIPEVLKLQTNQVQAMEGLLFWVESPSQTDYTMHRSTKQWPLISLYFLTPQGVGWGGGGITIDNNDYNESNERWPIEP